MKEIIISIENNLVIEKRDLNVYHHASRGAHLIGWKSFISLPLRSVESNDYLYFSIVGGPGAMIMKCLVNLPAWLSFEFISEGKLTVHHSEGRILLHIPSGLTGWQMKLTHSASGFRKYTGTVSISEE